MRVAIRDRETLQGIHPARVGAYLQARGWKRVALEANRYSMWLSPSAEPVEVLLPLSSSFADFTERMAELLGDLQHEEQRSQLDILRDIELNHCDVFRFRKEPRSGFLGAIQLEDGVRFVSYARDMLLYAATAEHEPGRSTVSGRRPDDVSAFMARALLGQTEVSSFVVTAQVPVPARLEDPLFPELLTADSEPFERRVGVRLMDSLRHTREAALESAQTHDLQPFTDVLGKGATINLYSAIVEAQDIVRGEALSIGCSWAPVRPVVGSAPPQVVTFEPEIMQPLRSAVAVLKPRAPRVGERLYGFVELLRQPAQEVLIGELGITTLVEGKARKVRFSLQEPEYSLAITAFKEKRPLEITGDLVKTGNTWTLSNPRDLFLHPGAEMAIEDGEGLDP